MLLLWPIAGVGVLLWPIARVGAQATASKKVKRARQKARQVQQRSADALRGLPVEQVLLPSGCMPQDAIIKNALLLCGAPLIVVALVMVLCQLQGLQTEGSLLWLEFFAGMAECTYAQLRAGRT